MIESPTANFSGSEAALFSPTEIRTLMTAEHERATRYGHELTCLVIGVDRIEQLADFYGHESREEVIESVVELLLSRLRVGDFLGCRDADRLVIALPFTSAEGARALAQRLLAGAREIFFSSEGRTLRISVSIGAAYSDDPACTCFDDLCEAATKGLWEAASSGGGRFIEKRVEPDKPDVDQVALRTELEARVELLRESLHNVNVPAPPPELPSDQTLADKLRELLQKDSSSVGGGGGGVDLQREVQDLIQQHNRQIQVLERRIGKLSTSLEATEGQLSEMALLRDVDPGVASVFRSVQGIEEQGPQAEVKRGVMSAIFDANMLLQEEIARRASDR
ncbi:MAG: diguanylate cyclase (GGDEF)-like protein [Planctomycetota bacterium]